MPWEGRTRPESPKEANQVEAAASRAAELGLPKQVIVLERRKVFAFPRFGQDLPLLASEPSFRLRLTLSPLLVWYNMLAIVGNLMCRQLSLV